MDNDAATKIHILEEQLRNMQYRLRQTDQSLLAVFKLPPQRMKLMAMLLDLPLVTPEIIAQRLGIVEVRVAMNRLRKDLEKFSLEIQSRRKLGYWFTAETKAKIKSLVALNEVDFAYV